LLGAAQGFSNLQPGAITMNVLLVLSSNEPEIQWNALRFGNLLLESGEEVTIFLNGAGVDLCKGDSPAFPLKELSTLFTLSEGTLFG
jgi:uncharacterized protein involved in oxidation of intracellular sulfur